MGRGAYRRTASGPMKRPGIPRLGVAERTHKAHRIAHGAHECTWRLNEIYGIPYTLDICPCLGASCMDNVVLCLTYQRMMFPQAACHVLIGPCHGACLSVGFQPMKRPGTPRLQVAEGNSAVPAKHECRRTSAADMADSFSRRNGGHPRPQMRGILAADMADGFCRRNGGQSAQC